MPGRNLKLERTSSCPELNQDKQAFMLYLYDCILSVTAHGSAGKARPWPRWLPVTEVIPEEADSGRMSSGSAPNTLFTKGGLRLCGTTSSVLHQCFRVARDSPFQFHHMRNVWVDYQLQPQPLTRQLNVLKAL